MKKIAIVTLILSLIHVNCQAQATITRKQLDNLCDKMDAEITGTILAAKDSTMLTAFPLVFSKMERYPFLKYLSKVYKNKRTTYYHATNTDNGELLRISEGSIDTATTAQGTYPENMLETTYYFLNSELARVCVSRGELDYNSHPAFYYNLTICSFILSYKNSKLVNTQLFIEKQDEKVKLNKEAQSNWMRLMKINNNELKINAIELYGKYKDSLLKPIYYE